MAKKKPAARAKAKPSAKPSAKPKPSERDADYLATYGFTHEELEYAGLIIPNGEVHPSFKSASEKQGWGMALQFMYRETEKASGKLVTKIYSKEELYAGIEFGNSPGGIRGITVEEYTDIHTRYYALAVQGCFRLAMLSLRRMLEERWPGHEDTDVRIENLISQLRDDQYTSFSNMLGKAILIWATMHGVGEFFSLPITPQSLGGVATANKHAQKVAAFKIAYDELEKTRIPEKAILSKLSERRDANGKRVFGCIRTLKDYLKQIRGE